MTAWRRRAQARAAPTPELCWWAGRPLGGQHLMAQVLASAPAALASGPAALAWAPAHPGWAPVAPARAPRALWAFRCAPGAALARWGLRPVAQCWAAPVPLGRPRRQPAGPGPALAVSGARQRWRRCRAAWAPGEVAGRPGELSEVSSRWGWTEALGISFDDLKSFGAVNCAVRP